MAKTTKRGVVAPPTSLINAPSELVKAELRRRAELGDEKAKTAAPRVPLRMFIEGAWRYIDPKPFLPNWHVDAIADHLQAMSDGLINRLVINVPPGMAKSLITSVAWPAWEWGPNGHPEIRWLCTSYADSVVERDAQKCRQLMESTWYQLNWPTAFQLVSDQNKKDYFKNDKHGHRVSMTIGGGIGGHRADRIVIDDPTDPQEGLNIPAMEKAVHSWEHTLSVRALDDGSSVVLIMQRLGEADLSGYFLRQGVTHLRLPALYEAEHKCRVFINGDLFFEDPRRVEDEPLHEARKEATQMAMTLRSVNPYVFAGQQQQRPAPIGGGMIQHAWFQHWDVYDPATATLVRVGAIPEVLEDQIIVVDCAFKDGEDNSWVVMECWGRRESRAYLLDQLREHLDMPGTIAALRLFTAKHPRAFAKYVEDKANGPGVVQMLRSESPGLMTTSNDDQGAFCLKEFCKGSKEAKLAAIAPFFAARNVWVPPLATPWMAEYISELTTFPASRFDDQVDATAMGVWKLLAQFAAHVQASTTVHYGENLGLTVPMFDKAYGSTPKASEMAGLAFGGRGTGSDLGRRAFGG